MNPTYLFLLLSLIGSSFQLIPTITCPIPLLLPPGTYCYDSSNIGNINSLPPSGVTTVIFAQSLPPYTLTRNIRATNLVIDAQSFTIKSNINVGVMEIGDAPLYPTISLSFDGASVIATSLDIYFRGSFICCFFISFCNSWSCIFIRLHPGWKRRTTFICFFQRLLTQFDI